MKRFFFIMAAMLLSVGAFAQKESEEPLKGDVNGDGTVDVADIVSVIKIMEDGGGAVGEKMCYWYVGTNNGSPVEPDNFTDVASRIPESEILETGTVTVNGNYVYFVMPDTRHLESLVDEDGSAIDFSCTDVMGYHIYVTTDKINGQVKYRIEQTVYYWYVGQTDPSHRLSMEYVVTDNSSPGWRFTGNSLTSSYNYDTNANPILGTSRAEWYFALPKNSGLGVFDAQNTNYSTGTPISTVTFNNVTYNVWKTGSTRNFNAYYVRNK